MTEIERIAAAADRAANEMLGSNDVNEANEAASNALSALARQLRATAQDE